MIKPGKLKIHPLFLVFGAMFYYFKTEGIFWDMLFCWVVQEGGYILFCCRKGMDVRRLLITPVGIRADFSERAITFDQKLKLHFVGSILGILFGVVLFALEKGEMALLSLLLAGIRLFPVLPMEGGKIWLALLGRWKGTLRAASWLTKVGAGVGYGLCAFAIILGVLFPHAFVLLPVGLYLIYVNRHEFLQIAKNLYTGMLEEAEKPLREVPVSGKETPFELALHMNPYETIYFLRGNDGGVSQERVMLAVFTEKDTRWLWKIADEKNFGAKLL